MAQTTAHPARSLEVEPTLRFSDDRMQAVLRWPAAMPVEWRNVDRLMALLEEAGVLVGEDTQRILHDRLARFNEEPADTELLVAEGVRPQRGADGDIRWQPGFEPRRVHRVEPAGAPDDRAASTSGPDEPSEPPAVDFYEQSPFVTVTEGQHIATLTPPGIGRPGFDVFGQRAAPPPGRPYPIEYDATITLTPGGKLIARRAGLLIWSRYAMRISPVLNIDEHVDFSTGHVRFEGTVVVGGGVRDRFRIEAEQDVIVDGLIEAAHIQCEGTLRAMGGMAGRDVGTLTVGGDLFARYLDGVHATVAGEARIEREIMQSQLTIGGGLHLRGGDIIGGHTTVGGAVEIGTLGSDAGVPTELRLGLVEELTEPLNRLSAMLPPLDRKIEEVRQHVEQMAANQGRFGRTRIDQARQMLDHLRARRVTLCERIDDLAGQFDQQCVVDLTVYEAIHPKVTLLLPRCRLTFRDELLGPLHLRRSRAGRYHLDRGGGEIPFKEIAEVQSTVQW